MKVTFTEAGWEDYLWFQETDKRLLNEPIEEIQRTPFDGIGKPEANLSGYWSRRVRIEHPLVYKITEAGIVIVACRFHYRN